jgi:transposase
LWTGCQWKAIHRNWFGVSSSVLHERFQTWQQQGIWDKVLQTLVRFYNRQRRIRWKWQAIDSKSVPAPLGGEATGRNPTDRGKCGAKIHILVDERGAPLAVQLAGANQHDKWSVDDLVFSIVVPRPTKEQHLCLDKGYDFDDVHSISLPKSIMRNTSLTDGVAANPCQNQFLKTRTIQHDDGSWKGHLVGWLKGAVFAPDGAKKAKIGWPLCSSLVRVSCAI